MIKGALLAGTTALLAERANGLNAELREISAKWNPEDPYNQDWQTELYDATLKITD